MAAVVVVSRGFTCGGVTGLGGIGDTDATGGGGFLSMTVIRFWKRADVPRMLSRDLQGGYQLLDRRRGSRRWRVRQVATALDQQLVRLLRLSRPVDRHLLRVSGRQIRTEKEEVGLHSEVSSHLKHLPE